MNILLSADRNFKEPLKTLIYSICSTQRVDHPLCFYVYRNDLSDTDIQELKYIASLTKASLYIIDLPCDVEDSFNQVIATKLSDLKSSHLSKATYYRLFAPLVLYVDKILYIDADCIVKKDLSSFYYQAMQNYLVAACDQAAWDLPQLPFDDYPRKSIPEYFNAGIMLMNLDLLRRFFKANHLNFSNILELIDSSSYRDFDQGIFNTIVPKHLIKWENPLEYNMFINQKWDYGLAKASNKAEEHPIQYDLYEQCSILHYASPKKPWDTPLKLDYEKAKYYLYYSEELQKILKS